MDILNRADAPANACEHLPAERAEPSGSTCVECDSDNSLRLCATCGHVGCCDSQAGHARVHAAEADHPVIYQMPANAGFIWCYTDDRYLG